MLIDDRANYYNENQYPAYVPIEVSDNENKFQRTEEMAISEIAMDQIHPPAGYLSTLSQAELDPRNYKHVPNVWLNRIPYAGRALQRQDSRVPLLG